MKLDEILAEAKRDAKIDYSSLDRESVRGAELIEKYLQIAAHERVYLRSLERNLAEKKKLRWEYYLGKADAVEYQNNPNDKRILRGDVEVYLAADKELNDATDKITLQREKVAFLDGYIKMLQNRGFAIKNAIEFMKFSNGVG